MRICIIALGRLGKKVYQLSPNNSFGTYTNEDKIGFDCVHYDINQKEIPKRFFEASHILFNLPPSKIESYEVFHSLFQSLRDKKWIFISSTSVYGQSGEVDEDTIPEPETDNGKFLKQCEELVLQEKRNIVIRPAGLYDETSHPGNYLAGRENIKGGDQPINLIARDEVAKMIIDCVEHGHTGVINAVNTHHPKKSDYYQGYCERHKLAIPKFLSNDEQGKVVHTKYDEFKVNSKLP